MVHSVSLSVHVVVCLSVSGCTRMLARDAQAKLALIVADLSSVHPSVHLSVRDSLSLWSSIAAHFCSETIIGFFS